MLVRNKLLCLVKSYWANCPTCMPSAGFTDNITFIHETGLLDYIKYHYKDFQFGLVYDTEGKEHALVTQEYGSHCVSGVTIDFRDGRTAKLVDDGKGNKIWEKGEE